MFLLHKNPFGIFYFIIIHWSSNFATLQQQRNATIYPPVEPRFSSTISWSYKPDHWSVRYGNQERVAKFIGRKDWSDLSSFFVPWLGLAIKRNVQDFLGRKLRIEHLQVIIVVAFVVILLQKFYQFFAAVRTSYRTVLGIQVLCSVFPPCTGPSSSEHPPSQSLLYTKWAYHYNTSWELQNNNIKNRCQLILIYSIL